MNRPGDMVVSSDKFLSTIEEYCQRRGISLAEFSKESKVPIGTLHAARTHARRSATIALTGRTLRPLLETAGLSIDDLKAPADEQ